MLSGQGSVGAPEWRVSSISVEGGGGGAVGGGGWGRERAAGCRLGPREGLG